MQIIFLEAIYMEQCFFVHRNVIFLGAIYIEQCFFRAQTCHKDLSKPSSAVNFLFQVI